MSAISLVLKSGLVIENVHLRRGHVDCKINGVHVAIWSAGLMDSVLAWWKPWEELINSTQQKAVNPHDTKEARNEMLKACEKDVAGRIHDYLEKNAHLLQAEFGSFSSPHELNITVK
jgi:hypothetical protein